MKELYDNLLGKVERHRMALIGDVFYVAVTAVLFIVAGKVEDMVIFICIGVLLLFKDWYISGLHNNIYHLLEALEEVLEDEEGSESGAEVERN